MKKWKQIVVAVAVGLVVGAVAVGAWTTAEWREWDRRATAAEARSDTLSAYADSLVFVADSAIARGDSLAFVADTATGRVVVRWREVAAEPAPDTCAPFLAARDSVISDALAAAADWELAYDTLYTAAARLRVAYDTLHIAHDSLRVVLADRPRLRPWWAPKVSVGAFAGVCVDGRPCAGGGVGITVEVPIGDVLKKIF